MKNYFIIHGSFSNPYANWFPWLYNEIEKTKPQSQEEPICYVPQFPTGAGRQNYENWSSLLRTYVDTNVLDEKSCLFAHSIAPVFVCKFLIENKIKVDKLIFVCGFNNYLTPSKEYNEVNVSMFLDDIEKVKKYANEIVCIYSNNDPYVAYEVEKDFADKVSTKRIMIENGGHLNMASGFDKFPQLLEFI